MTSTPITVRCPRCNGIVRLPLPALSERMGAHGTGCRWRGPMTEAAAVMADALDAAARGIREGAAASRRTLAAAEYVDWSYWRGVLRQEDLAAVYEQEARWMRAVIGGGV